MILCCSPDLTDHLEAKKKTIYFENFLSEKKNVINFFCGFLLWNIQISKKFHAIPKMNISYIYKVKFIISDHFNYSIGKNAIFQPTSLLLLLDPVEVVEHFDCVII